VTMTDIPTVTTTVSVRLAHPMGEGPTADTLRIIEAVLAGALTCDVTVGWGELSDSGRPIIVDPAVPDDDLEAYRCPTCFATAEDWWEVSPIEEYRNVASIEGGVLTYYGPDAGDSYDGECRCKYCNTVLDLGDLDIQFG
jgi:hypothetical protein